MSCPAVLLPGDRVWTEHVNETCIVQKSDVVFGGAYYGNVMRKAINEQISG